MVPTRSGGGSTGLRDRNVAAPYSARNRLSEEDGFNCYFMVELAGAAGRDSTVHQE